MNVIIPNNNTIEYSSSSITLKIRGGNQYILHSTFYNNYPPNQFIVNEIPKTLTSCQYNFETTSDSMVELVWDSPIEDCSKMFFECSGIIEIDLSNFDSSEVKIMHFMFHSCSQLSSINLSKFNTSKVTDMGGLFLGCSQLASLILIQQMLWI